MSKTGKWTAHRQVIYGLLGYVPDSWWVLRQELLRLGPESKQQADYILNCMNKVEEGQSGPSWVTLPHLYRWGKTVQKDKVHLRPRWATKEYRAAWMQKHSHLGASAWLAAYKEEFLT